MYGPGSPLSALKHREVSSTITRHFSSVSFDRWAAANLHFSLDTSSGAPCSSGKSILRDTTSNGNSPVFRAARMARTSSSFFALPVTNTRRGLPARAMAAMCGR